MRILKNPFTIAFLVLLLLVGINWLVFFKPAFVKSYTSPNGAYTLEVYAERRLISAPGDGSSNMAIIVLKKGGKKIATVTPADDCCNILVNDVEVEWNEDYVSYGMARIIDLKTGKFD